MCKPRLRVGMVLNMVPLSAQQADARDAAFESGKSLFLPIDLWVVDGGRRICAATAVVSRASGRRTSK